MDKRLFVLTLAALAVGTQTYSFTGVLAELAGGLDIPVAVAGQLALVFSIFYALSAPLGGSLTAGFGRRKVIVSALGILGLLNLAAGLAPTFPALLAVRALCGLAAPLVIPVAIAATSTLAPPDRRGQAMAVVMSGLTLAYLIGIPAGAVVGAHYGWRAPFVMSGGVALAAALAVGTTLPPLPSGDRAGLRTLSVVFRRAVAMPLCLSVLAFSATFTVIAFFGPVITTVTGRTGAGIAVMQSFIGVGSFVGILVGGRLADRATGPLTLPATFALIALSLLAVCALSLWPAVLPPPWLGGVLAGVITLNAAAMFGIGPILQTRLIDAAPHTRSVVMGLNAATVFLGQGLGAGLGGLVAHWAGLVWLGLAGALVGLGGLLLAVREEGRGRAAGPS